MGLYTSRHLTARFTPVPNLFMAFVRWYCRLQIEGREHIPKRGGFVLAANHSSHADTAVVFSSLPAQRRDTVVAAAAQDYFFDQGYRQYVSRVLFNVIPLARKPAPGVDPLRHVIRAIREGYGVLLFPEGTRSQNKQIGAFRSGIGRIVAEFPGLPVIPVALSGTEDVLPKRAFLPRRTDVTVRYGEPLCDLHATLTNRASWKVVAQEIRSAVVELHDQTNMA